MTQQEKENSDLQKNIPNELKPVEALDAQFTKELIEAKEYQDKTLKKDIPLPDDKKNPIIEEKVKESVIMGIENRANSLIDSIISEEELISNDVSSVTEDKIHDISRSIGQLNTKQKGNCSQQLQTLSVENVIFKNYFVINFYTAIIR